MLKKISKKPYKTRIFRKMLVLKILIKVYTLIFYDFPKFVKKFIALYCI